ncbi:MAG TPA: hypothetical protein VE505_10975 [Vicinamibacterales bacterium]|nr:hypothetical protein [Vicinamibacterales bacterium]
MAVEHSSDDLQDLAEQLSGMRVLLLEALTMLADRERRLERSRELYARLRDENRRLRAAIMQADTKRAA